MKTEQAQTLPPSSLDPELLPWLAAPAGCAAEALLERLLAEQVEPVLREIVSYQFRVFGEAAGRAAQLSESEDVCAEVRLQLVARLNELKRQPLAQGIHNLRSYVAVTAYRACYEYLRRKYPRRYGLKHKVRFVLNQQPQFALWTTGRQQWVAGWPAWEAQKLPLAGRQHPQISGWLAAPQTFLAAHQLTGRADAAGLTQLLTVIFNALQQPLDLDELVNLVAAFCGIKDLPPLTESSTDDASNWLAQVADQAPDVAETLAQRSHLSRLWQEIRQMSPRHCAALLLNLRDEKGSSVTELLVYTGVASFRALAAALALTESELAELWQKLPLDDLTLAKRLDLTRQQIINLRRSARERLWRRMNGLV